ncbi:hypothetical protein PILCRDRAFT_737507 [Piloderma croceum F 1598]|uniref:Uncharacterized protein n=1 Tax=Piloderma croceum (strain F 1598) TaxID=765440 RepID=A0A0C3EXX4_PILCF|nr:hypothetical protein PILCRDRAFT_737507 [Piloderma croceum F 1598]
MANIVRSAKSGSDWTINEINAYNIIITLQDVATFFGHPILPHPSVHQVILDNEKYPVGGIQDTNDRMFFYYLDEYNAPNNRYIRQRKDIPFFICRTDSHAQTDVCMIDRNLGILLLVQEDKRHMESKNPEPQLIAKAIAAFQSNNLRLQSLGRQPLAQKTIPGITMVGSTPTFYKITVTQNLIDAIQVGEYTGTATTVHKLLPPVADITELARLGMRSLDNRTVILSCFEAFRQFL